jgi:putative selenate reductase
MAELVPIPFDKLLKRIYHEYGRNNSIFDLPATKFYRPDPSLDLSVIFCGKEAANPVGPAAGPHTQLTQNIVLSWLAGSRMLELKTVQIKDRLELTRPCIDIHNIGYNTEWSQELRLEESLREYVKAAMIIEMLKHWFEQTGFRFTESQEPLDPRTVKLDTIFDTSVGYDLAGIQSPQIRSWLRSMQDASELIDEYRMQIPDEFRHSSDIPFRIRLSDSITLSTFHGTPAGEIESICEFLLTEMDYHVIIKMNPPMLGKDRLEYLLYDKLGYTNVEVNEKAYEVNITFDDAVDVVKRLQNVASRNNKTLGVKFGNTLEVHNKGNFLKDKIQYLSGQPLHVLHLALVHEWRKVFGPDFPISFAAGVDAQNFTDCVNIGLVPITTCTDLLRPGGYGRLPKYLYNLQASMKKHNAVTIGDYIVGTADPNNADRDTGFKRALLSNTERLLDESIENPRYHAGNNRKTPNKIGSHLYLWDCINCDKCIPVCPNDANFFFEIEPVNLSYQNIRIENGSWELVDGGDFTVKKSHQIANFADACNDCGNCDVFCPEDGGPYIEKPRFFGSLEQWKEWRKLSGFVLVKENGNISLYGRFNDRNYNLTLDEAKKEAVFSNDEFSINVDWDSSVIIDAASHGNTMVNMEYYYAMRALMNGMLNSSRVHFVNTDLLQL